MSRFLNHKGNILVLRSCREIGCKLPAVFGRNVNMQLMAKRLAANDVEGARTAAGVWACGEHRSA